MSTNRSPKLEQKCLFHSHSGLNMAKSALNKATSASPNDDRRAKYRALVLELNEIERRVDQLESEVNTENGFVDMTVAEITSGYTQNKAASLKAFMQDVMT